MSRRDAYLDRSYSSEWHVDGTTEFHAMCAAYIPSGAEILDIGAGASNPTSRYLSSLGRLADSSFDACVSNYVLEHIADPRSHLEEIVRILRPGGVYLFRTPNRYQYVTLTSRLTPHWFHKVAANRLRNLSDEAPDPYPTQYLLNSRRVLHRAAARAGLDVRELRMVEKEPSYGMASRLLFLTFPLYERVVNSSPLFAQLRVNIFGVLARPPDL